METSGEQITLGELPIGSRLVLRCKKDWREAVVSQFDEDKAVLIIWSLSGKTYRVRRPTDAQIVLDGEIPILPVECDEIEWRENLIKYDTRW
ncbi:MAG: hypothetical protein M3209_19715 [Acidobacteriota bacterium]|nr:hypothetical protein [Acidobacteriota bacterium]